MLQSDQSYLMMYGGCRWDVGSLILYLNIHQCDCIDVYITTCKSSDLYLQLQRPILRLYKAALLNCNNMKQKQLSCPYCLK